MKKDDKFNVEIIREMTFHNLLKDEKLKSIYEDLKELIIDKASEGADSILYVGETLELGLKVEKIFNLLGFSTISGYKPTDVNTPFTLTISW